MLPGHRVKIHRNTGDIEYIKINLINRNQLS